MLKLGVEVEIIVLMVKLIRVNKIIWWVVNYLVIKFESGRMILIISM